MCSLLVMFWCCFYFTLSSPCVMPRSSHKLHIYSLGEWSVLGYYRKPLYVSFDLITLASEMQLSMAISYFSPNTPPFQKPQCVCYWIWLIKRCIINVNRNEVLLHCTFSLSLRCASTINFSLVVSWLNVSPVLNWIFSCFTWLMFNYKQ
jgi:hypothetical protein